MAVLPFDPATASVSTLDGVYRVLVNCHSESNPEEPYRTRPELEAFLRHPPASDLRDHWLAEEAGRCVGFAQLLAARGATVARAEIQVEPGARDRGHGAALLAARRGARDAQREVRSLLRPPLDAALVSRPVRGYRLRSWVGAAPGRLLASYADARGAINDAPTPSDEEPDVWDTARVRDLEAALERRDREVRVDRAPGAVARTEDTAVVAEHRRRGLGRWIKLESLRRLQEERPDVALVTTGNAEENDAMLELNRGLGFSRVAVYTNCVLELQG
jgi:GNAT superfamily N-acetyltransferase